MKIYRNAGGIPWPEIEDEGVRVTMMHLVFEGDEFSIARLPLNLFPPDEVVMEVNFRRGRNLGENVKKFIVGELDRRAFLQIKAMEKGEFSKLSKWELKFPFEREVAETYKLGHIFHARREQIHGTVPWINTDLEDPYPILDAITKRWLKMWVKKGLRDIREDVYKWLSALAQNQGVRNQYCSWAAQEILEVAYCPMCHEEEPSRRGEGRAKYSYP